MEVATKEDLLSMQAKWKEAVTVHLLGQLNDYVLKERVVHHDCALPTLLRRTKCSRGKVHAHPLELAYPEGAEVTAHGSAAQ